MISLMLYVVEISMFKIFKILNISKYFKEENLNVLRILNTEISTA
jgi:hypothetical protein